MKSKSKTQQNINYQPPKKNSMERSQTENLSNFRNQNLSSDSDELSDADAMKILQKLAKQGKESAEVYMSQGREDLAEEEMAQVRVIEEYLPAKLSEAELEERLKAIIAEVGATSCKEMGKVMGVASKLLAGLAEGSAISACVKKLLS